MSEWTRYEVATATRATVPDYLPVLSTIVRGDR